MRNAAKFRPWRLLAIPRLAAWAAVLAAVATLAVPAAAQPPPAGPERPRFVWKDHPSLRIGKGTRIDFRAQLQGDLRRSDAPVEEEEEAPLDFARRRIGIEGEIANLVDFQVERELSDDDDPWRDIFVNYKQFDIVQVQAGKFKLPFSLDERTSSMNLDFVHRSLATDTLAPGRDRGLMIHGAIVDRIVRYELGVFDHDGRNARTRSQTRVSGGRTLAGRVTVEPFKASRSPASDMQLGLAWTTAEIAEGFSALRGRTTLGSPFFAPDFAVRGRRRRTGIEARWRPGPFSLKAEHMRVSTERRAQSVEDSDLSPMVASGWYVSGTWAVTGENKADGLDNPRRPFPSDGPGAVEIAVRLERLAFGSEATGEAPSSSPRADVIVGNAVSAFTVGVNWYLNRWIKIQANAIRETVDAPARGPLPSRPSFWNSVIRLQLAL